MFILSFERLLLLLFFFFFWTLCIFQWVIVERKVLSLIRSFFFCLLFCCCLLAAEKCGSMWWLAFTWLWGYVEGHGGNFIVAFFLRYSASKIFQTLFRNTAVEHYTFVPVYVISPRFQSQARFDHANCNSWLFLWMLSVNWYFKHLQTKNHILGVFLDCEWDLWNRLMITFIFSSLVIWTAVYFTSSFFFCSILSGVQTPFLINFMSKGDNLLLCILILSPLFLLHSGKGDNSDALETSRQKSTTISICTWWWWGYHI